MRCIVPLNGSALDRILSLSAFDGDSAAALRTLHAHFAARFPDCSLALVFVAGQTAGECRLAGLIGPDGTEHVPNLDPFGQRMTLPLFADALTMRLFADVAPRTVRVAPTEFALPFAQALLEPAALFGVPIVNSGEVQHWLVFGSTFHPRFDRIDPDAVLLETNLAASLIIRPLATRALRDETARRRRAIEDIADVQRLLLPDNPAIRGLEYAVHWQPADTAAGDYYDLMPLTQLAPDDFVDEGADIWALMLADVSGHGAAAAMEAAQFDAILRTYQGDDESGPGRRADLCEPLFFLAPPAPAFSDCVRTALSSGPAPRDLCRRGPSAAAAPARRCGDTARRRRADSARHPARLRVPQQRVRRRSRRRVRAVHGWCRRSARSQGAAVRRRASRLADRRADRSSRRRCCRCCAMR